MAYTSIDDPSVHFQVATYAGAGGSQTVTNDGNSDLKPDLVYVKNRSINSEPTFIDTTRGGNKFLYTGGSGTSAEESADGNGIASFNTDGITWDTVASTYFNSSGSNFVAWQWKANGGTTTAFSESGNNPGGTYQANTTAGFSIVTYTGTGAAGTVTHGLGVAPKFIIIKNRGVTDPWAVYYGDATDYLVLNTDAATVDNAAWWNDTAPSSTVFTVNTDHSVNADGEDYIAYCFAEVQGYSKFGSYVGNGNADGSFVYTGFKPAFVMFKNSNAAFDWTIVDNKREGYNLINKRLSANIPDAEATYNVLDFVSNGFKLRDAYGIWNGSGNTLIYMAFAENPFVTSTGVPTTAR